MPLWRRIADETERAITVGRYALGDRVPGEAELALTFATSRDTAGRALDELEKRGVVVRKQGLGTFVTGRRGAERFRLDYIGPELTFEEAPRSDEPRELLVRAAGRIVAQVLLTRDGLWQPDISVLTEASLLAGFTSDRWRRTINVAVEANQTHSSLVLVVRECLVDDFAARTSELEARLDPNCWSVRADIIC